MPSRNYRKLEVLNASANEDLRELAEGWRHDAESFRSKMDTADKPKQLEGAIKAMECAADELEAVIDDE